MSRMIVDQLDREGVEVRENPHLLPSERRFARVAERSLAPLVPGLSRRERLQLGELTDEANVAALSNDLERRSRLEVEVVSEFFRNRQSPAIVDFGRPVLIFVGWIVGLAHRTTIILSSIHDYIKSR